MDPAIEQHFTDELKADPVVTEYYGKTDYKSVPDVLKGFAHAQKRLGSVVPLLNGDSKPEDIAAWRQEHLPKLINAKLVDAPIKPPDKYEVKLPEGVPAEAWGDADTELAQGFAKKHGLSQAALDDGLAVVASVLGKYGATVQVNREASMAKIKEWADKEGVSVEQVNAALTRFNSDPNGWDEATAKAVSDAGFADNPLVVKAIYKLMKDSGTFDTRNDGGSMDDQQSQDGKAATAEANDIIRNKDNPKYTLYHRGDEAVGLYVANLLKKGIPGTVEI
jgi:hypothetical protein